MGNTLVVKVWAPTENGYEYIEVYSGESWIEAAKIMWEYRNSVSCIQLEWRP
jgi:hypothetical protein